MTAIALDDSKQRTRRAPRAKERPHKPDQDKLAIEIARDLKGKVGHFYGDWHVYEQGIWRPRVEQYVVQYVREQLRAYRHLGVSVTYGLCKGVVKLMEGDFIVSDSDSNALAVEKRKYIPLKNGLYNLETHELEPHNPEWYFTNLLDFDYNPTADCPTYRQFKRTSLVDASSQSDFMLSVLLDEALAYSMTARTDLKASFWLVGKPDSGKSTFIGFVRALMGQFHTTIDLNRLAGNQFILSSIVGKRIVTTTEAESGGVLPDGLYKALVGGADEVWADVKNKPGISFVPEAKLWWAMNEAPRVVDRSGATHNRLYPILFNRTIPVEERKAGLLDALIAERSGIFNVLMSAYKNLTHIGRLTLPDQCKAWLDEFRLESDTERTFLTEQCELNADFRIGSEDLYRAYKLWCEEFGFRPKNVNQTVKDWERLGLKRYRSNGRTFWKGAKLRESTRAF